MTISFLEWNNDAFFSVQIPYWDRRDSNAADK
jgi:hypothetical protein